MSDLVDQIVQRFATLLDERRYDDLADVLAPECIYEFRDSRIQGAGTIIETYRTNTEWGFGVFDRIEFQSEVFPVSESSARVRFRDHLYVGEKQHLHTCEQVVTVDESGRIVRITHCDLDGESEALNAFLQQHCLSRPSQDSIS